MKYLVAFILVVAATIGAHADTGVLSGLISDRTTGSMLMGVTVRIDGTQSGAISDKNGKFRIKNIPTGKVVVVASLVGYEMYRGTFYVRENENKDIVFTMMPSAIQTQDVVISASKRVQAVQDVPVSVSIVKAEDLQQRNITRIDESLKYVSGVTVARDQINIRGSSGFAFGVGSRTMVLLDGFPLLSGDNGDVKFDVMPVADVERMEVIKGAGSALYGTGALGGVVSMITKEPTAAGELSLRTYGGLYTLPRYDEWQYRQTMPAQWGADVRYARKFQDLSVNISGGIRNDDSYRSFDQGTRGFLYTKFGYQISENASMKLFGLYANEEKQNYIYWESLPRATFPPPSQNPSEKLRSTKLAAGVEWFQVLSSTTSLIIRPVIYRTRYENFIDNVVLDSNSSTAWSGNIEAQLTSRLAEPLVLTTGIVARANVVSSTVYGSQIQYIGSGYGQAEYTPLDRLIITAGLRIDLEQTKTLSSELELSPKVGVTWKSTDALTMRASAGRGFRAPTIAERYANIRYGPFLVEQNLGLRSESSLSFEVGAHYSGSSGSVPFELDLAVFDNELYNLIEPLLPCGSLSAQIQFQNITRARILGAELTGRVMLAKGLGLETGLTAMLPRDLIEQATLKYRNNIIWYSRASWTVSKLFDVQMEYRFLNRVERIDQCIIDLNVIPNVDARVPAHIVDARLIHDMRSWTSLPIRLTLNAKNLLDYYYTEIIANLAPTRSIVLQAEIKFQ
ncbi:MAG: TonB-dependent receptor [Bacteroidetes bacterium]|nr:TonB-dependent receptor [Bacteroidota bacterium]